jgi:TolA-binding protein
MDISLIKRALAVLPHPKMVHVEIVVVLILATVCFWAGGASKPVKTVEKQVEVIKTVTVTHEDTTKITDLTTQLRELQAKLVVIQQDRHWQKVTVKHADGSSETRESLDSSRDQRTETTATRTASTNVVDTTIIKVDQRTDAEHLMVKEKTVTSQQAQWLLTPMVGWDFNGHDVTYGLAASRRVIGPFWMGIWAHNRGPEVGLAVSMEF